MEKQSFLIMNSNDNCATTVTELGQGKEVKIGDKFLKINQEIPYGHKFATIEIKKGEKIIKYGQIIGLAVEDIKMGDWIHTHNIKSYYLERINNE